MARFTVDTHLFRELGALLVGRDSTALIELIKNAYDADATEVIVYGEALDNTERGFITISDNGVGMTPDEFEKGFLRIASRIKDAGERLSKKYNRRFTGAKGIGRLAAHKLARYVQIYSVPWYKKMPLTGAVEASIDWDIVEKSETLDDLEDTAIIQENIKSVAPNATTGTVITLRRLRRRWTAAERGRFLTEVQTFAPPPALVSLPEGTIDKQLLFGLPKIRDNSTSDPGFKIRLDGEFTQGDDYWQNIAQVANWIIEINALGKHGKVEYVVAPTQKTRRENPEAERKKFSMDHPAPDSGPFFQARILIREGPLAASSHVREWARRAAGIRVFMEGFRVLPYGEPGNDWLEIDADYTRRQRTLSSLREGAFAEYFSGEVEDEDAALMALRNDAYLGAVFLTQSNASALQMLVNREGFIPEAAYDRLTDMVRKGIDLSVRVRAAARRTIREDRKSQRVTGKSEGDRQSRQLEPTVSLKQITEESIARAKSITTEARQLVAAGDVKLAADAFSKAISEFEAATQAQEKRISESAMLGVLASVGTQMASFIHEINGLLGMAESLESALERLRNDSSLSRQVKQDMAKLQGNAGDLRRSLERQASYLLNVVTPDARRRRVRQSLAERFDAGARLVAHLAERRAITIANEIPIDLKSPAMFPAELTTVFSNLLTNAVKAAGQNGKIRSSAKQRADGAIVLTVENTGARVELRDSERWFKPFESTTETVDPVLGQGMGLGLPITRNMLEEYGAEIKFVQPSKGFSTAVEITFPK